MRDAHKPLSSTIGLTRPTPIGRDMLSRGRGCPLLSARALLAALAVVLTGGCGAPDAPAARNAVLIVVDTLRRDHLGSYGYHRDTSPAIDRLARESVVFERAYATSGWTAPSVASILTGLYPSAHRLEQPKTALPDSVPTLAEALRDAGFATVGIVSNVILGAKSGLQRGFDELDEAHAGGHRYVSTPGVTDTAIAALERLSAAERPFFLFVHYFDPHHVYRSHPEYGFAASSAGRLDGAESIVNLRAMRPPLDADEVAFIRDLYDEEVRYTDSGIARLLDALKALGRTDDTAVLLTADHGEEFLERGWLGHTRTLYDELVRVPLMIRVPGVAPRRISREAISLTALAPTLLELLGVAAPAHFQQRSLAPLLTGDSWSDAPPLMEVDFVPVYQEYAGKQTRRQSLVVGRWKIIRDAIAGRLELYDIELDPGETQNLAHQEPEQLRTLTRQLDRRLREVSAAGTSAKSRTLSEQETEALRALGYGD